jgi:hypothetical protein
MTQALLRLGTTLWWVLVDTEAETIIDKYHRPQVAADIAAIQNTLASYPSETTMENDLQAVISLVNNYAGATAERKARVVAMLNEMWQAYQKESKLFDAAQLREKLARLQGLLAQMVV